ncbi:family 1 glycosylhydrolase [Sphingomonas desiccabilis]|uniref:dTDP-4-dehydrorhamnose reductase n=1 Tax=Sphingomonas desiccabilis TaxID=429134 RepID=A0A4Q2IWS8_9SPHN|nr:family 1 glycosylhydrolase [Sphingomonas desiccabilis]MBB3910575.1 dTDP-4-dehydrorhamnose reductase [Sphingomonas desiccabilis]RXZ35209.1 NAD-dependent epimerase/dehydratase family protein [Sphingomonas desiccabilis]
MPDIELWGGVECTVNRTRDGYLDQCRLSGHHDRSSDLDRFAELGLKALRYPVLWERVAPRGPDGADWRWSDERLGRLRALGIRPIVGLVHHGSGPPCTNLLDPGFAPGLARFAGQVAQRYPWLEAWTPVNEPLTTARFSALYGHWYPHAADEGSFWLALLNQIDGVRLAMQAVRRVNPGAQLIQTDDLGRAYATTRLTEQAAFENLRRWAGWDLLFGRVTRHHPLWERIAVFGLGDRLQAIADAPCPPDIVGVNHYLTSDRFLDHRLQCYPPSTHGGNGRLAYADTEAIRVLDPPPAGLAGAVREAWQRYHTPVAITEVHNGCTREEQLRWAAEAWDTACALRELGGDLRAVTAWSLLGSHGWDTLLTGSGSYEPGVFDVSSGTPRPTALAALWRGFPTGAPRHPLAQQAGWWRRPERLLHPPLPHPGTTRRHDAGPATPPLLILGATGTLGQALARACSARHITYVLSDRSLIDLQRPQSFGRTLDEIAPWAVVNAAGWVRVDAAEEDEEACHRSNATGAVALAQACAERGIGYLGFSSDLVFAGDQDRPYVESDPVRPLNAYGRSKAAMEAGCAGLDNALIVRTAAFFSPHDRFNFAQAVLDTLEAGGTFDAARDHVVTPSYVPQLVDAALDLLIDGATGLWHLSNGEVLSWAEFGKRIATCAGHDADRVKAITGPLPDWRAPRPGAVGLATQRGAPLGSLDDAIQRFVRERSALRASAQRPVRVVG